MHADQVDAEGKDRRSVRGRVQDCVDEATGNEAKVEEGKEGQGWICSGGRGISSGDRRGSWRREALEVSRERCD